MKTGEARLRNAFRLIFFLGLALAMTASHPGTPDAYPPDPTADIPWSSGTSGVADIQAAFNNARSTEEAQLGLTLPDMTLPSQATWDAKTDSEKALWLINQERVARSVTPLHGTESNVTSVAEYYANYLLTNDVFGHEEDGRTPWERLEDNAAIGACHDFLNVAENLYVSVTSGSSIDLPVESAVYEWLYNDSGSSWGHRHAILWYPYNDNSGTAGMEGFVGIGRAEGGPYQGPFTSSWNFASIVVMNVFDPCSTWNYGTVSPDGYEPDNTYSQAKWLAPNGASTTHNFHVAADYDWMKFNATAGWRYTITTFNLGATSDTFLYLYSTNGITILAYNDDYIGLGSQIIFSAPASGTYYIRVRHHSSTTYGTTTNYTVGITGVAATPDGYETDDTYSQAKWISPNGASMTHNFHDAADYDWIKFNAIAGLRYIITTFNLGATSDTFLYLYSTNGTTILGTNDDYGSGAASQIAWTAPSSGTYYIRVRHHSSTTYGNTTNYSLGVTVGVPDGYEVDDTYTQAKWTSTNGASMTHNFHDAADYDWVKFNTIYGWSYSITTSDLGADCDTFLYLYGTNGTTVLAYNDDFSAPASQIIFTAPTSGTYYARVRDYSSTNFGPTTNYNISVYGYHSPKPAGGEFVLVPDHKAVNPGETVNVEVCVRAEQPVTALDFHILNKSPFIQVTDLAARDNPLQPVHINALPAVAEEFDGKPVAYDTPVQALFDAEVDLTAISCIADFKAQISSEANISDLLNIKAYGTAANASGEQIELRVGSLPLAWATKPTIHSVGPNAIQPGDETQLTIRGVGFVDGVRVRLNDVEIANVTFVDPETLQLTVPAGLAPGVYKLIVTYPDNRIITLPEGLIVLWPHNGQVIFLPMVIR